MRELLSSEQEPTSGQPALGPEELTAPEEEARPSKQLTALVSPLRMKLTDTASITSPTGTGVTSALKRLAASAPTIRVQIRTDPFH